MKLHWRVQRSQCQLTVTVTVSWLLHHDATPQAKQTFDVQLADLKENPMKIVQSIYQHFGWELDPGSRATMQAWLDSQSKFKYGRHKVKLADFGLTGDKILAHSTFARYCVEFNISDCVQALREGN